METNLDYSESSPRQVLINKLIPVVFLTYNNDQEIMPYIYSDIIVVLILNACDCYFII